MCNVTGCEKKIFGHGYCNAHYKKWRKYGNPEHGRVNAPAGEPMKFIEDNIGFDGDDCLIWPYCKDRYGNISTFDGFKKSTMPASRMMCLAAHGKPPSADHHAAHECGNAHCVNPTHLSWKTPKENGEDKVTHKTSARCDDNGQAVLRPGEADVIRGLAGTFHDRKEMTQEQVGAMFGISQSQVSRIVLRKSWEPHAS